MGIIPNNWFKATPSVVGLMKAISITLSFGVLLAGCVAQQADVVRIKRELDAKISQLDKSKTSLQQAVTDANTALEKANVLIAGQRAEIQQLLQNRAEVMDQMATLKDTDLSEVRGAIEKNQHVVGEIDQKIGVLNTKMQNVESQVQQSRKAIEPLVQDLKTQLTAEEQLRAEQGGKLGEFRTSLVDYQQVLTSLRQNVAHQEKQVAALQGQVGRMEQNQTMNFQQVQTEVNDIRQHIKSVIGTLEEVSTTFSKRLDAYEQKGLSGPQQARVDRALPPSESSLTSRMPPRGQLSQSSFATNSPSSGQTSKASIQSHRRSQGMVSEAGVSNGSRSSIPSSSLKRAVPSEKKTTQQEQVAYDQAFNLLRGKKYVGAAQKFSGFLRIFPNSRLAANSQYWLGECYYGERRFQEAIDEFERVLTFYPSSNKVPASLLKIGYSHLELQQPSRARSVFQQLVRIYPQSKAAIKAHGRLQEVNALLHNPS